MYDRLLLATGSTPFILPVPGKDLQGVIAYRDIADTNAMIEAAQKYKRAVVIGGGLLGLEAANGLMKVRHAGQRGARHALADGAPARWAGKLLQKSLEERGLKFLIGAQTQELVGGEDGRQGDQVHDRHRASKADLVVMAVGIRPNTELAEKAGLHCNRGTARHPADGDRRAHLFGGRVRGASWTPTAWSRPCSSRPRWRPTTRRSSESAATPAR